MCMAFQTNDQNVCSNRHRCLGCPEPLRFPADGSFPSLQLRKDIPIPAFGDTQVLIKFEAASLNYGNLIIPMGCQLLYRRIALSLEGIVDRLS